jgi:hypothetical protein
MASETSVRAWEGAYRHYGRAWEWTALPKGDPAADRDHYHLSCPPRLRPGFALTTAPGEHAKGSTDSATPASPQIP